MSKLKPKRYFQYRVTAVGGDMIGRIEVGQLTLDYWHGTSHRYTVMDLRRGEETGWYSVKSEGEATSEQYARLRDAGKAVAS